MNEAKHAFRERSKKELNEKHKDGRRQKEKYILNVPMLSCDKIE